MHCLSNVQLILCEKKCLLGYRADNYYFCLLKHYLCLAAFCNVSAVEVKIEKQ